MFDRHEICRHSSHAHKKGEMKMFWYLSRLSKASLSSLLACFVVLGCVSAAMSQAQSNAADLQGTVRDQNGAVVANASVVVRNAGTNASREATTNDDGYYKIVNLAPGDYELTVKATNYKTA